MGQSSSRDTNTESADSASSFENYFKNFKLESRILSAEKKALIQYSLERGDLGNAILIAKETLSDVENAPLSIAVTGETGAGKSTLINALRGLGNEDEGAAATGPVEITMQRTKYTHPNLPNVSIWDLPGIGSTNFPPEKYLEQVKFDQYDLFLIVSATRFKHNDVQLAKGIAKMQKNFYFLRTKVDVDVISEQIAKPRTFDRDSTLQRIRDDCLKNLKEAQVKASEIFLISTIQRSDYDFPNLESTLLRDLPAQKRHIFMQCLPTVTEAAIDWKAEALKQKAWLEALKEGAFALIPLGSLFTEAEVKKLEATFTRYRAHFGLDDASLDRIADEFEVSVEDIKARLQCHCLLSAQRDGSFGNMIIEIVEGVLAAPGGIFATFRHFRKILPLRYYFIDTLATDAKALLKKEDLFGASSSSG